MDDNIRQRASIRGTHIYEIALILSGVLMLLSVGVIYLFEDFTVWTAAKVLYGLGVLLFTRYA